MSISLGILGNVAILGILKLSFISMALLMCLDIAGIVVLVIFSVLYDVFKDHPLEFMVKESFWGKNNYYNAWADDRLENFEKQLKAFQLLNVEDIELKLRREMQEFYNMFIAPQLSFAAPHARTGRASSTKE